MFLSVSGASKYLRQKTDVRSSGKAILRLLRPFDEIIFIRLYGNIGDDLIYAGTRRLLSGLPYREVAWRSVEDSLDGLEGKVALLAGSGGWCEPFHAVPRILRSLEERFDQVVVMPTSFDAGVPLVRDVLKHTRAHIFAREPASFRQIRSLCTATLAHDSAFFFDFSRYRIKGTGILRAFRTDNEAIDSVVPANNIDISLICESLDEWLWTIARHEVIYTDRGHVMIAAALLGKRVFYRPSSYHKVPAIAEWALRTYPVTRLAPARIGSGELM